MLKRPITYTDFFTGETVTETFYFNLTEVELVELQFGKEGGFDEFLKKIVEEQDNAQLVAMFKQLTLMAYGVKSDDGKRHIKTDQLREEFSQTAAYPALFMELASNSAKAAEFVNGVLPADLAEKVKQEELKKKTGKALGTSDSPYPPVPPSATDKAIAEMGKNPEA